MNFLNIINIIKPIKKHYSSLRKDASCEIIIGIFFILPIGVAALLVFLAKLTFTIAYINTLIAVFAVFVGFSIDALIMLLDRESDTKIRRVLIIHTSYNVIYNLIIGIIILVSCLLISLFYENITGILLTIISFIFHSLLGHFLITLLMIARRLYYTVFIKSKEWGFED